MIKAALVLEGGSLRSLYTAGVLDYFLNKNLEFESIIAVSAGALTAANYISKQIRRTAEINILHSCDSNYYGLKQLLLKRAAFNFDFLFNAPINDLYHYDNTALQNTQQKFYISATNCLTGKTKYFKVGKDYDEMAQYLQASSSLPLLAPMMNIDGEFYLDGGIVEPIGITKALEEKYEKIVVVLTKEQDYIREPYSRLIRSLFKIYYRKFPILLNALKDMPAIYNDFKQKIDKLEREKKVFVIRPQTLPSMGYIEKDARKLVQLYFQGLYDAEQSNCAMEEYLNS